MQDKVCKHSFTRAEKTGVIALLLAFFCAWVSPAFAIIPLSLFLLLCLVAPFFPGFSFYLPIISKGNKKQCLGIALTFDDGPSPESTPLILELLARHKLKATFFVVGEKAAQFPHLIKAILSQGHSLGNHSWHHDYLLMLRSSEKLQKDIHETQEILRSLGGQTRYFRPPSGITNSRLAKVLGRENLITVNFSCRAFDRGNRNIDRLADKIASRLRPGDIIMLHDLPPYHPEQSRKWQQELDQLFKILAKKHSIESLELLL